MDQALKINTHSLKSIIYLAKHGSQVVTPVVQVSTCFVNGFNQGTMLEQVNGSASGFITKKANGLYDIDPVMASI
jgi:hypothetical protein